MDDHSQTPPPPATPNERLAAIVAAALSEAALIPAERAAEVRRKLADGDAQEQDWRFWIEQALTAGKKMEVRDVEEAETH
jgi:hypothetical protein